MEVDSDAKQVPFFSDAIYGRKVKRRYFVWLLMVGTFATYLLSEPLTDSSIRRLVFLPFYWAGLVFIGGWLYDVFWKGKWGRLEIQTRWLVWWFISLWATLVGANPWPIQAVSYGVIVALAGVLIDVDRKRHNVRRLITNRTGMVANLSTSPHEARQFSVGEPLVRKDTVLVVKEVGFDYVYAGPASDEEAKAIEEKYDLF